MTHEPSLRKAAFRAVSPVSLATRYLAGVGDPGTFFDGQISRSGGVTQGFMTMSAKRWFVSMVTVLAVAACGGAGEDLVVVDEQRTIAEGAQVSFALISGTYQATITSSNNGVLISWLGGSGCTTSIETKSYSATCAIGSAGQLVIFNPTLLGVGGDEMVRIRVVRN